MDRDVYDTLNLTIAQHPSETVERMMVRVLVFCINYNASLEFTKGLSEIEEPDLWIREFDGSIPIWIEVGEPEPDRVKKATRLAKQVLIYSFNSKSNVWWKQSQSKLSRLPGEYYQLAWPQVQSLAAMVERGMDMTVSISEQSAYFTTPSGECELAWTELQRTEPN